MKLKLSMAFFGIAAAFLLIILIIAFVTPASPKRENPSNDTLSMYDSNGQLHSFKLMPGIDAEAIQSDLESKGYNTSTDKRDYGYEYTFDNGNGSYLVCRGKNPKHIYEIYGGSTNHDFSTHKQILSYISKLSINMKVDTEFFGDGRYKRRESLLTVSKP